MHETVWFLSFQSVLLNQILQQAPFLLANVIANLLYLSKLHVALLQFLINIETYTYIEI